MKYTINTNTIDVEYIANGKRKQLKLKNDDEIDMDFFNQLMKANSNKRDAMCELFRRKILQEDAEDTVHIQPLKLDKELKPSKYAEQEELKRRKTELEQDKKNIGNEAKVLVKDDAKNKDVNALTEADLNNPEDANKLKEIQSRYAQIDKVYRMVVNQVDNLDINNATSVRINEIKELNVETFKKLEQYINKFDLTEASRNDLLNELSKILGFKQIDNDTLIGVKYLISSIPQMNANAAIKLRNYINENGITPEDSIRADVLKEALGADDFKSIEEPLKNALLLSLNDADAFSANFETYINPEYHIKPLIKDNWSDFVDSIIELFPDPPEDEKYNSYDTIGFEIMELTRENLNTILKDLNYVPKEGSTISESIMYNTKPYTLLVKSSKNDFKDNALAKILFKINNEDYITTETINIKKSKAGDAYSLTVKVINNDILYDEDEMEELVNSFAKLLSLQKTDNIGPILGDVQFYFNYYQKSAISASPQIMSDVFKMGDVLKFQKMKQDIDKMNKKLKLVKPKHKNEPKPEMKEIKEMKEEKHDDTDEEENDEPQMKDDKKRDDSSSEGLNGGRIMIDLNKSTTDEKLNEIIRLLSQMNYNVFTTTPMYKNNRYTQSSKQNQNQNQKNTAKGIDLYDVLDL